MFKVFQSWVDRYFSDEEAVMLFVLLIIALGVILTLGGMLAPVIAGLILAFLMQGLVNKLEQLGVGHAISVTLIFLIFVSACGAFFLIVVPEAWRQLINLLKELPQMLSHGQNLLMLLPDRYPDLITTDHIQNIINQATEELTRLGQLAVSFSLASIANVVTILVYLILVPILMFFFMKDGENMLKWFASLLPQKRDVITQVALEMELQIANYVRGKAVEIVIVGAVSYVAFAFFGLRYSALLALMVGLSVVIPYIGAALVTLPVALIAFFQWGLSSDFVWLMGVYLLIQALDGNALVPLLFSEAVNLHPVAIIVAVLVFGGIWGFWGVFFAIPLATLIKAVFSAWPHHGKARLDSSSVPQE